VLDGLVVWERSVEVAGSRSPALSASRLLRRAINAVPESPISSYREKPLLSLPSTAYVAEALAPFTREN